MNSSKKYFQLLTIFGAAVLLSLGTCLAQAVSGPVVNFYKRDNTLCINDVQRAEIKQHIAANISLLQSTGKLPMIYSQQSVLFNWPLKLRAGLVDYGYHSIANFVDNASPGQLLDYNCGDITYDGHKGIDYYLWPFSWNKMDSSDVEIVAAVGGTIVYKSDGNYDRSCGTNSNNWNSVCILHTDGSEAWYGHMKKYSLTTKTVGQTVATGEYLGSVGSSGNSTGPHLHFEIYDAQGDLNDPYTGSCNIFNNSPWWNNQRPYVDAGINHIATNHTPPDFNPCSQQDTKNESDYFTNTDNIYLILYYRFFSTGDSTQFTIYRPDSTVWESWWHVSTWPDYTSAWLYYSRILGSNEPNGQWKFEANYKNQTYFHNFWIGQSGTNELSSDNGFNISPNPSNGIFHVEGLMNKENFEVYTILGEKIALIHYPSPNGEGTVINLSNQSKGIYFLQVKREGKSYSQKIIIE